MSKDEIHANLKNIVERSKSESGQSCGVLTAEDREHWASLRESLSKSSTNADILRKIDGALFVLCLDDKKYADEYEAMKMFLHGDGSNRSVRYFYLTFSKFVHRIALQLIEHQHKTLVKNYFLTLFHSANVWINDH